MYKFVYIILFLCSLLLSVDTRAQKNYVYQDTAIYKDEEAPIVEEAPDELISSTQYEQVYIDTSLYEREIFLNWDSVNALKKAKAFAYVNYLDSLLKKQQDKPKPKEPKVNLSWLDRFFSSGLLKVILWTLAIAFVLFILYKLFLTKGIFQRNTTNKDGIKPIVEEEEISAQTNFDLLIQKAEQNKQYRLAIRYRYLKALHTLAEKNWVQLAADKTNYQYVMEVKETDTRNLFAALTLNYEYVWYGEFDIDNLVYDKLRNTFNHFNDHIS